MFDLRAWDRANEIREIEAICRDEFSHIIRMAHVRERTAEQAEREFWQHLAEQGYAFGDAMLAARPKRVRGLQVS